MKTGKTITILPAILLLTILLVPLPSTTAICGPCTGSDIIVTDGPSDLSATSGTFVTFNLTLKIVNNTYHSYGYFRLYILFDADTFDFIKTLNDPNGNVVDGKAVYTLFYGTGTTEFNASSEKEITVTIEVRPDDGVHTINYWGCSYLGGCLHAPVEIGNATSIQILNPIFWVGLFVVIGVVVFFVYIGISEIRKRR